MRKMGNKEEDPEQMISTPAEDSLIKDTTISEKYHVFEISKRLSKYLSGLLFAAGAIAILVSGVYFIESTSLLLLGSKSLILLVLGFIATVNLICGLLLLTKE